MTLGEIRTEFINTSGRQDLVTAAATGSTPLQAPRADYFLRAGQRWLDNQVEFQKDSAEVPVAITSGSYTADLAGVRSVISVRFVDSEGMNHPLTHLTLSKLREQFAGQSFADIEASLPSYYSLGILRDGTATATADKEVKRQILMLPPPDVAGTLYVFAEVYSGELTSDDSVSYWSLAHPDMLVLAGLMVMEEHHRNTSGVNDYRNSLLDKLRGLSANLADEEASKVDQMGEHLVMARGEENRAHSKIEKKRPRNAYPFHAYMPTLEPGIPWKYQFSQSIVMEDLSITFPHENVDGGEVTIIKHNVDDSVTRWTYDVEGSEGLMLAGTIEVLHGEVLEVQTSVRLEEVTINAIQVL